MARQRQANSTLCFGAMLTTTPTQLEIFYTNVEGQAINRIYQAVDEGFDGLVMNPAGFTYAGFALKDCSRERVCRTWKCTSAVLRSATSTVSYPMWPKE